MSIIDLTEFARRKQAQAASPAVAASVSHREEGTLLLAVFPGSGRHLQVLSHVCGYLAKPEGGTAESHRAVILAEGRDYVKVCQALGGTYVDVYGAGEYATERFGDTPLFVYDFSRVTGPITEPLDELTFGHPDTLLVIDGATGILSRYPRAFSLTTRYAKAGSGVMVMGNTADEVRCFEMAHKHVLLLLPEEA